MIDATMLESAQALPSVPYAPGWMLVALTARGVAASA